MNFIESFFGLLLAFALGTVSTELARVRGEEKNTEFILKELLFEINQIKAAGESGKIGRIYSSTWSSIKASGLPSRIRQDLRKTLAEVFLHLEIYNDYYRCHEDYIIQPSTEKRIKDLLKNRTDQSKKKLLELCEEVLQLALSFGVQWQK